MSLSLPKAPNQVHTRSPTGFFPIPWKGTTEHRDKSHLPEVTQTINSLLLLTTSGSCPCLSFDLQRLSVNGQDLLASPHSVWPMWSTALTKLFPFLYPVHSRPLNQAEWLGALISPHSFKHRAGCILAVATPPEGRAQDCPVRQSYMTWY